VLERTFLHVPGVGVVTEARLWRAGIRKWQDLLDARAQPPIRLRRPIEALRCIEESCACLQRAEYRFFARSLPAREHWRAYPEFRQRIAYLDIETTGLSLDHAVTVIGLYDGTGVHTFVRGDNMDEFPDAVSRYALLVTFNGATFDLPFLRRAFPSLPFDQLHVDLRYALSRLGHGGGLKAIEGRLGIRRSPETKGLDGFDAVRLWHEYLRGSEASLELLIRYNTEDVRNLEDLMRLAYEGLCRQTLCGAGVD
jgi:uncharacterized protein YprB with RNaseH-like and TPR domain